MNADQAKHVIASMAQTITEHQALLSRLDTTIGDGDHGHNLAKAFAEADSAVQLLEAPDLQTIWRVTGRTIRDSVGGASGLLFGAFFTGAARTLADKDHVSISDFVEMLEAGVAAVQKRGKANPGDKTMVDTLVQAVEAGQEAINQNSSLDSALAQVAVAAQKGAESTQDMIAQHGRAKFLGERSKGFQDAGATSMALLLKAWAEAI